MGPRPKFFSAARGDKLGRILDFSLETGWLGKIIKPPAAKAALVFPVLARLRLYGTKAGFAREGVFLNRER
jgi:hypothetical protein